MVMLTFETALIPGMLASNILAVVAEIAFVELGLAMAANIFRKVEMPILVVAPAPKMEVDKLLSIVSEISELELLPAIETKRAREITPEASAVELAAGIEASICLSISTATVPPAVKMVDPSSPVR